MLVLVAILDEALELVPHSGGSGVDALARPLLALEAGGLGLLDLVLALGPALDSWSLA